MRIIIQLVKAEDQPVLVGQFLYDRQQIVERYIQIVIAYRRVGDNIVVHRKHVDRFFITADGLIDRDAFHPAFERTVAFVLVDFCENLNKRIVQVVFGFDIITAILEAKDKQGVLIRLV